MRLEFLRHNGVYAVCRLDPLEGMPAWLAGPGFLSLSVGVEEQSIVALDERVPDDVEATRGWTAYRLGSTFAFDEAGVVLAAVRPVSEAGFGVFVVSTFLRDYILVKVEDAEAVERLWLTAGHSVADARTL